MAQEIEAKIRAAVGVSGVIGGGSDESEEVEE
jgi:hypothetical protein